MRVCQCMHQPSRSKPRVFDTSCGSGGAESALKVEIGEFELDLIRTPRGYGEVDAAYAGAHLRPEFEQLETNGGDSGVGELAMAQTDAAQGIDKNIGHGREPHAELIGLHRRR